LPSLLSHLPKIVSLWDNLAAFYLFGVNYFSGGIFFCGFSVVFVLDTVLPGNRIKLHHQKIGPSVPKYPLKTPDPCSGNGNWARRLHGTISLLVALKFTAYSPHTHRTRLAGGVRSQLPMGPRAIPIRRTQPSLQNPLATRTLGRRIDTILSTCVGSKKW